VSESHHRPPEGGVVAVRRDDVAGERHNPIMPG
jgi:hypothetical protein